MTEQQQTEVIRRAKQDAQAIRAGWPSKGNPFHLQEEIDLYEAYFAAALKEGRK